MNDEKLVEAIIEILLDHANVEEAAAVNLKHRIAELVGVKEAVAVKEETFSRLLGWQQTQGSKLGTFEFTTRETNNNSDGFNHAYNVLKASSATIRKRFHGQEYQFSYWLFDGKPETIYRQLLKK